MIYKQIMKKNIKLTKKQICMIAVLFVLIFVIIVGILNREKNDNGNFNDRTREYIVTENFVENTDEFMRNYEVRYYLQERKSYLVLSEENGSITDKTISEIKTEFKNEYIKFNINSSVKTKIADLNKYADDSGFIYTCNVEEIKSYLINEVLVGKLRFSYATPLYFECFIENEKGEFMRGLLLYNSDFKTGTFIYKKCNDDASIPTVSDFVTVLERDGAIND